MRVLNKLKANITRLFKEEHSEQNNTTSKSSDHVIIHVVLNEPTKAIIFAETVRGILYVILSASIVVAILFDQKSFIVTVDEIVTNLLVISSGKFILIIIALALFIFGLKNLRILR